MNARRVPWWGWLLVALLVLVVLGRAVALLWTALVAVVVVYVAYRALGIFRRKGGG